jgi:hypothetical protein
MPTDAGAAKGDIGDFNVWIQKDPLMSGASG